MTGTITSAVCNSWKGEAGFAAGHCFSPSMTLTGTMASGAQTVTAASTITGLSIGMGITATNLTAGAIVESFLSSTSFTVSRAATAAITGGTFTAVGDVFKIALIKFGPTGTYDATVVNYSTLTGNADEASGTNYTAGGIALVNVAWALASGTAWTTFNDSPATTWTNVTVATAGALIYNTNARVGGTSGTNAIGANRAAGVFSYGGEEQVTAGTYTVTFPSTANGLFSIT